MTSSLSYGMELYGVKPDRVIVTPNLIILISIVNPFIGFWGEGAANAGLHIPLAVTIQATTYPVLNLILKGGPVMIPLVALSILTLATTLEQGWFWLRLLRQEGRIVHDVLEAARYNLSDALMIAEQAQDVAIGRFLLAPLQLKQPSPETFRLALESAADREFVKMRKGDKFLETVVAIAPLLGLLGTVTGLIVTFNNLDIGGGAGEGATLAAAGIGEALITTAAGMVVAILALAVFRLFVTLQSQQMDYFSEVGTDLELIYRQVWYEAQAETIPTSTPITS